MKPASNRFLNLLFLLSFIFQTSAWACPNLNEGESSQDCPWADLARKSQGKSLEDISALLSSQAPKFLESLKEDAGQPALKALWGQSLNFDEIAKATIVDPSIVSFLITSFFNSKPAHPVDTTRVHAGLIHTYGYLLSTLKTPYGFKRARWVSGEIEQGFDLPEGALLSGPILINITTFLGRISFSESKNPANTFSQFKKKVHPSIQKFNYRSLRFTEIQEDFHFKDETNKPQHYRLDTLLVPFVKKLKDPNTQNRYLIIYKWVNLREPANSREKLITAFPVTEDFVAGLSKPELFGRDREIKTRYNAFLPHSVPSPIKGTRAFFTERRPK